MPIRASNSADFAARAGRCGWMLLLCLLSSGASPVVECAQAQVKLASGPSPVSGPSASEADNPQPLDSVIAVVNNQVILASDLDLEMRIFHLLPINDVRDFTRTKALERLTTRALIEQQIVLEDPHGLDISSTDLKDSLAELRESLPACKQRDCASASGWSAYLATLGLTADRVSEYWSQRIAVLRFIELRFRSGIRITPEEIDKYYRETLVPLYAKRNDAPPLEKFSSRIQEILLQQRVNALLGDWLKSLQDQGQVEILDPALRAEAATASTPEKGGKP
jgi:peptidyl-prolyl cis-trans isomerase SurA